MSFADYLLESFSSIAINSDLNQKNVDWMKWNSDDDYLTRIKNQDRFQDLLKKTSNNNEVINRIKTNFDYKNSPSYLVQDLTISLCRLCLDTNQQQFNEELFKTKCSILKPFLNKKIELELEALKAVQLIDTELNEKNTTFIRSVFDIFSDCYIVREGAFYKWKSAEEKLGNKQGVKRLRDFFTNESQKQRIQRKNPTETTQQATNTFQTNMTRKQRKEFFTQAKANSNNQVKAANTEPDQDRLIQIFNQYDTDQVELLQRLKIEFNNKETLNKKLICILVNALCKSCMDSNKLFKITAFNKRCLVLKDFINKNETIEIETMKTIQEFFNQIENKIPGFDQVVFLFLYENSIVNKKALDKFTNPSAPQAVNTQKQKRERRRPNRKESGQNVKQEIDKPNSVPKSTEPTKKFEKFLTQKEIETKLSVIFNDYNLTADDILKRINDEFTENQKKIHLFIIELMLCFLKSCLHGVHFNSEFFKKRVSLLNAIINENKNSEIAILTCVANFCQAIQNMTDLNLIAIIFDILYMEKVVKKNSFFRWNSKADDKTKEPLKEFFHKLEQTSRSRSRSTFSNQHQPQPLPKQYTSQFVPNMIQPMPISVINSVPQIPVQYYMPMPLAQPQMIAPIYPAQVFSNPVQTNIPMNKKFNQPKQQFNKQNNSNPKQNLKKFNQKESTLTSVDSSSQSSDPICPICIETISNLKMLKIRLMSTQCGHILCKPCTEKLFAKTNTIECPMCRTHLNKKSIHDLFI